MKGTKNKREKNTEINVGNCINQFKRVLINEQK